MSKARGRVAGLDVLRVIGVAAIVASHAGAPAPVNAALFLWHVPLFFFLSGFLASSTRPVRRELHTRWHSIGRPYAAWLVIGIAEAVALAVVHGSNPIGSILGGIWGGSIAAAPFTTFWFLAALFWAALAHRALQGLALWLQWVIALAGYLAGLAAGEQLSALPLSVGQAVYCYVFVLAGATLARFRSIPPIALIALVPGSAAGLYFAARGDLPTLDLKSGDLGEAFTTLALALVVCVTLTNIGQQWQVAADSRSARAVTALATTLIVPVLMHPMVLLLLADSGWGWEATFGTAFTVSTLAGLPLARTRAAGWLVGATPARSETSRVGTSPTPFAT